MASQRQLEANRANARRSTGPKSALGKECSRGNAITHGLTARQIIVAGEKAEDFDALREAFFADLQPNGTFQCELVGEIARFQWRIRRIPVLEAQLLNRVTKREFGANLSRLTKEELEQLEKIYRKFQPHAERRLSLTDEDDEKTEGIPRRIEMLAILSRYEAGLIAGRNKALNLFYAIKQANEIAEGNVRIMMSCRTSGSPKQ